MSHSTLERTIELEVIPQLLRRHERGGAGQGPQLYDAAHVIDFSNLLLGQDSGHIRAHVQGLIATGETLENVYLKLFTPAAQRLGVLWEEDRCDFADVTIGVWRLQQLMHEAEPAFRAESGGGDSHRILLMAAPGDQHTFGVAMVGEFFVRAGWLVHMPLQADARMAAALVSEQWFDVVGLSLGSSTKIEPLLNCISELRRNSRNPAVHVMVGGSLVAAKPELVAVVGADSAAADASDAVRQAERVVAAAKRAR